MTTIAGPLTAPRPRGAGGWARVADYASLARPRILPLVLLTAPPALGLGREWPDPVTAGAALAGTALVAAGAAALNAWYERDLDARMSRTRDRALAAGRLDARRALAFGLALVGLGLASLWSCSALGAALGLAAVLHYVVVYTAWLKPRSPTAVVVGAATGASAPLIAAAAAHGTVPAWSLVLFAIVFLWQPPHFWAIALYRRDEYAAAGFPLLPSEAGAHATRRRMLGYAAALVPVTLLPCLAAEVGLAYGATAIGAGALFLGSIARAVRDRCDASDRRVFRVSLVYLALVFAALNADLALG